MENLRVLRDWEVLPMDPPFFKGSHQREIHTKWYRGHISAPGPQIKKTKVTFFSSTFKVWESKVSLLFWFAAQETRYWQFHPLQIGRTLHPTFRRRYGHDHINLGYWATNKKSKDTFHFQTVKVKGKKVFLFFSFMAHGARYRHFVHLTIPRTSLPKFQKIKWPYLGSWATNQKTKDTFFSSTFKVWESKVSLFF